MSGQPDQPSNENSLQERLVQRLKAIPRGEFAQVATRAEMSERQLLRIRSGGEMANVTLRTLERIARGLQLPASAVIAAPGEDAYVRERTREVVPPEISSALTDALQRVRDAETVLRAGMRRARGPRKR